MIWKIGQRIYDADYHRFGVIVDIYDCVIYVRWDNGNTSDFTPDESTVIVGE